MLDELQIRHDDREAFEILIFNAPSSSSPAINCLACQATACDVDDDPYCHFCNKACDMYLGQTCDTDPGCQAEMY